MVQDANVALAKPSKVRWGELDENDAEDLEFLLPPPRVIGANENGIKKVIDYKFDDDGNMRAVERRSWTKFEDAVHEDVGSRLTMVSTEEIVLEHPRAPGGQKGADLMVCRTCGKKGDHWTSKCPYKDIAPQDEAFVDKPTVSEPTASKSSAYVPPIVRRAAAEKTGTKMRRRNEENSVRVTNLSGDNCEPYLLELFHTFGLVNRVYVAIDQRTGLSRGFGFVNFVSKEDAERAIGKLNGYGYDNLILRVEWATPRTN